MNICPLCKNEEPKHLIGKSPYYSCTECGLWFQDPLPPKRFEAEEEKGEDGRSIGHIMIANDKVVTDNLAHAYANNWVKEVPMQEGRSTYKILDIGAKYPYFISRLRFELGGAEAYGIDAMDQDNPGADPIAKVYEEELGVDMLMVDFEKITTEEIIAKTSDSKLFDSISMVHVFEHIYDPEKGIEDLYNLIQPNGIVFLRMPSHDVKDWEWHMGPRQYCIHPFYWSVQAFRLLITKTKKFEIVETYPIGGGSRDYLLKPLK